MNYFYLYLLPQPKYTNPRLEIIGSYQILVKTGRVLCVYNLKTRISLFAYPLSEVLRKPKVSNKQCRNPRCVYVYTRAYLNRGTHGCIIHPMSIYYCLVFEDFLLKFLRFQKVKNKR